MALSTCFFPDDFLCFFVLEGMHIYSRGSGWGTDGQCMLGTLLSGARNPSEWSPDLWQAKHGRQWWRIVQHVLQRNQRGEACAPGYLCGPGAERCGYVFLLSLSRQMAQKQSCICNSDIWESRLIQTYSSLRTNIYIAFISCLFGKQSKQLFWGRGEDSENCCPMPKAEDNSFLGFFTTWGQ